MGVFGNLVCVGVRDAPGGVKVFGKGLFGLCPGNLLVPRRDF